MSSGVSSTILITGGSGLVGRSVAVNLCGRGYRVVSLARDDLGAVAREAWTGLDIHHVPGDANDVDLLARLIDQWNVSRIVHAAAITGVPEDYGHGLHDYVTANVATTSAVVEAATRQNILRLLYVSSASVYLPKIEGADSISEDAPLRTGDLYASTKISSEAIILCAKAKGLDCRIARVAAVFGPNECPTAMRPDVSPVTRILHAARTGRTIELTDPDVGLDWTFVDDVARGICMLIDSTQLRHSIYNVASGISTTYSQVLAASRLAIAAQNDTTIVPTTPGSAEVIAPTPHARRQRLSIRRLVDDTGFHPRFSFEDAISETLRLEHR